jgi:urea transport system ATP-binding protein
MGIQSKTFPEEIIQVKEVTVDFSGFKALNELNFTVERGELRVVIGPNGAGKTTLLDAITGKVKPSTGQILFQPNERPLCDLADYNEAEIARLGIGRKFQTPNVFKSLSVVDNIKLALNYPRGVFRTLLAPFLQDGKDRIAEILTTIGLAAKAYKDAGTLAHGEKQWLELGMLMAQDPELLLVDEPVAGMTPRESERTGELLLALSRKHTLLVIDHDMTFVRQIAGKVTVLHEGRLLSQGTIGEVQDNPKVIEVYLGHHKIDKKPAPKTTAAAPSMNPQLARV